MKEKKTWFVLGILAVVLAACLGGRVLIKNNFLIMDQVLYNLNERELNFSGREVPDLNALTRFRKLRKLDIRGSGVPQEDLKWLKEQMPDCEILWKIEFQGELCSPYVKKLTLETLTREDVEILDNMSELETVYAWKCRDYDNLCELARRHPDCEVKYYVNLGGIAWSQDSRELVLEDETAENVSRSLPWLPQAERVKFTGKLPSVEDLQKLEETFPDVEFDWQVRLGERLVGRHVVRVDLTQAKVTNPRDFVNARPYLPELQIVSLRKSEIPQARIRKLVSDYPDLEFRWDVQIGGSTVYSHAQKAEITGKLESTDQIRDALPWLKSLRKLVVLDSGLSNEDLDALNQELPDVRIAWNLMCGGIMIRTDDTYYAPNKYEFHDVRTDTLETLKYCPDMICVDVGHGYMTNCEWVSSMPHLKYLILADSPLKDLSPLSDLKELVYLEIFLTPVDDYTPLLGCTALEDLNICRTHGDPETIMQMTWLKRLWWHNREFSQKDFEKALPNTQVVRSPASSTGRGWRQGERYYEMRDFIGMWYMSG